MHYVIGDIHNDSNRFQKMLSKIGFRQNGENCGSWYVEKEEKR